MFDTIQFSKFRCMAALMTATLVISGLPLTRSSNAYTGGNAGSRLSAIPAFAAPVVQSPPPTYNLLLQDDSSGNMLRWNSTTGDYQYSRCGDGFILTGTGSVSSRGYTFTLTQYGADRRISATLDASRQSGTASIQYPLGTTDTLTDRSWTPDPGLSDQIPPQVVVTAPNGGEIIDTGSIFTISWTASDNVAVTSQDVLLSTDGGATFTPIVSGLAGSVNQYAWTAPVIASNQTARVRVVARDAACNASRDDSDANFTVWNPSTTFTHVAEAPLYVTSGGFNSAINICNESSSPRAVELDFHKPSGNATANAPTQITLAPGEARTLDVANYLTIGAPSSSTDPNIVKGSVRLRHNGSSDGDVRALITVDHLRREQSFTTPFVYAASSQSPTSSMQCGTMYYVDSKCSAYLSLQNVTNGPVNVDLKLCYGTGAAGTSNGAYQLPTMTLGGQESRILNLANYASQLQGTDWGSVELFAPAQSVVAHTAMMSPTYNWAFDNRFVDPAGCTQTTRAASTLKLDYNMNLNAYVMVCNLSSTTSHTITANFQTNNGVVIPSQQLTLAGGQQSLIQLNAGQLLTAGQSTMADVRLVFTGNPSDVMAGACSMSSASSCAFAAHFVEAKSSDGQRLTSPFFKFDQRNSGIVQVSNMSAAPVKAGVSMMLANTSLQPLTSDVFTVPAGGTATLNLQPYLNQIPDGVSATGCIDLVHNGTPGQVSGSVVVIGTGSEITQESPFDPGQPLVTGQPTIFPDAATDQPAEPMTVSVMIQGATGQPTWSVTSTTSGCTGTVTPLSSSDPNMFYASYTPPADCDPGTVTVTATSGGSSASTTITIQKVKLVDFVTLDAVGNVRTYPDGTVITRLNPDGGTRFRITSKASQVFPDGVLQVRFRQNGQDVVANSVVKTAPNVLEGIAAVNNLYVGDAQIIVFDATGAKISKDNSGAAYYAYDPPSPPTSVNNSFNRLGGNLTITAAGGGFRRFDSSIPGVAPLLPTVKIGAIDFAANTVTVGTPSTINGNVQRAGPEISSCAVEGQVPCKSIKVINPGGRSQDKTLSTVPLYNLLPGPAPIPQSRFPDNGFSIGGTPISILGAPSQGNLDFVTSVTIGGTLAVIVSQSQTLLLVISAPHVAGGGNAITLFDIDNSAPAGTPVPGGAFTYLLSPVTLVGPGFSQFNFSAVYIVGPGEGLGVTNLTTSSSINCLTVTVNVTSTPAPLQFPGVSASLVRVSFDSSGCPSQTNAYDGDITFTLVNTSAPTNTALAKDASVHVHFVK